MDDRRGDKIIEIEDYLKNLKEFFPSKLDEYVSDLKTKAACERYFEKTVEAAIDLVFIVVKERGFRNPDSNKDAIKVLSENNIISQELSEKLGNAKSMRNWLAHRYGKVNDKLVFDSLKNEFFGDVEKLVEAIR